MNEKNFETLFVDENPEVINALAASFGRKWPEAVRFTVGNILAAGPGVIVSPTNGYGDMGEGLDLQLRTWYTSLERRLQHHISLRPSKRLPIGAVVWIETGDHHHPMVIFSPTFRTLPDIASPNRVYRAAFAVFSSVRAYNAMAIKEPVSKVLMPGLGTGVGGVDVTIAASKICQAYRRSLAIPTDELEIPVVLRTED